MMARGVVPAPRLVRDDPSNGYDACAEAFLRARNPGVGALVMLEWAASLPTGAAVLDVGCGSGVPGCQLLLNAGCTVYGVDASATMVTAFRRRFPAVPVECASLEESEFFGRSFAGVVAIGVLFLLSPGAQSRAIARLAKVLDPRGKLLFT